MVMSPNHESEQYGGNELPCQRSASALVIYCVYTPNDGHLKSCHFNT